jgi:ABC-2 type transport system permease protein
MELIEIFQDSYRIAVKDLMEFKRNRAELLTVVMMPFLLLIVAGFLFPTSTTYTNVPVALVDLDNSQLSHQFVTQLTEMNKKTNTMDIEYASSLDDAKTLIMQGQVYGAIIIPNGYSKNITAGKQTNVIILSDNSIPQISLIMNNIGAKIVDDIGASMGLVEIRQSNLTVNPQTVIAPLIPDPQGMVPGNLSYFDFVAPGMLVMIAMVGAMSGIPRAIAHEKEIGTVDGILAAPVNEISIIVGKTMAQVVRGFIAGLTVLVMAILLFGVTIHGNILLAFFMLFLGIFSLIGLGILLTSVFKTESAAAVVIQMLSFPLMFISGVFFPIQQMPWFMQDFALVLPVTYAVNAMHKIMILNAGVTDVLPEIAILVVFGLITVAIAIPVFRRSMTR